MGLPQRIFLLVFFSFLGTIGWSQTRYNMSNQTITECQGILVDSEKGKDPGVPNGYGANEDFCFTICVPNSPNITITFTEFRLEPETGNNGELWDYVSVYDGPDCSGPLMGEWTGNNNPGSLTSSGQCISIRFRSDDSKSAPGFELFWNATPPPPSPPAIQAIPNVSCNSTSVTINFDQPIPCSQLTPANFNTAGPSGSSVSSVTPINCVNGFATSALLTFNSPLNQSGTYCLSFDFVFIDICGKGYRFTISQCFNIIDCPLIVQISGNNTVCDSSCVTLTANVQGGNPAAYRYNWTPGGMITQSVSVCPTTNQTYTVTVTDGSSQPASATHSVTVLPRPNAGQDTALCRFSSDFNQFGTPSGGTWFGNGIINGPNGTFRPNQAGTHSVFYTGPNGCSDERKITVWPVSAGPRRPVCLNSPPFQLNGSPTAGTWSGTYIDPAGIFTPTTTGTFTETYIEPTYGCSATTVVEVVDSVTIADTSILKACDNQPPFNLAFSPVGGLWSGNGIVTSWQGTFNPAVAGPGTHMLYYTIQGCSDSTDITVNVIDAGADTLVCPSNASYKIPAGSPFGGVWTGPGIVDNGDSTYNFNPALAPPNTTFYLKYTYLGCTDSARMFLYNTTVTNDSLSFCEYDGTAWLDPAFTQPNIPGGVWSGTGLVAPDSINPKALSPGVNFVYYEYNNNGCRDSLKIRINTKPNAGLDTLVCPKEVDFPRFGSPAGGTWSGSGITPSGIFSPITAGGGFPGDYDIYYTINGCTDTATMHLQSVNSNFFGLAPYYCLKTANVALSPTPTGGTFYGPGIGGNTFDPKLAGTGIHTITYIVGNGACADTSEKSVKVLAPITFNMSYPHNKVCYGDLVTVNLDVHGGDSTKTFYYSWIPNNGNNSFNSFRVKGPTTFTVTVTDNCSDPKTNSGLIDCHPEIRYDKDTGTAKCYGEDNWAKVSVTTNPTTDFKVVWKLPPPNITDSISQPGGRYDFTVWNTKTGCKVTDFIRIPYFPLVQANFLKTPFEKCVTIDDPRFDFINLSTGADTGYWFLGDTLIHLGKNNNLNPTRVYKDTGDYHIKLFIKNVYGCSDSLETDLCILPVKQYAMPNTFTPNGDGHNDLFPMGEWVNGRYLPTGYGITDYTMIIADRWGHLLYETDDVRTPWNGKYFNNGDPVKTGVYVYRMLIYFGERDIKELKGKIVLLRDQRP